MILRTQYPKQPQRRARFALRMARALRTAALAALFLAAAGGARADTIGMVGDGPGNQVIVFNADTLVVLADIDLPNPSLGVLDVLVMPDQSLGFVLAGASQVYVIDLQANPPVLAEDTGPAPNPIITSALGTDLSLSPDQRYLLVSGAGFGVAEEVSVIDIAARGEVSSLNPSAARNVAIEACRDDAGSVLVASSARTVRLLLSDMGVLTSSSEALSEPASNVTCAPDGQTAVQILYDPNDSVIESFDVTGMTTFEQRSGFAELGADLGRVSGLVFHPSGESFIVRAGGTGSTADLLTTFAYNPGTGDIGSRQTTAATAEGLTHQDGVEQIAVHPDGKTLYVPMPGRLEAYDSRTLALKLFVNGLSSGVGVRTVALSGRSGEMQIEVDTDPLSGLGWLHPLRGTLVAVTLLSSVSFDATDVDEATLRFGPRSAKPLLAGQVVDVNTDGLDDLQVLFRSKDVKLGASRVEFCANGRLDDRARFSGCRWLRKGD